MHYTSSSTPPYTPRGLVYHRNVVDGATAIDGAVLCSAKTMSITLRGSQLVAVLLRRAVAIIHLDLCC
jgi:hypothetical protein